MRDMEVRVTKYVLEYYENLNLTGLVLFVEDNLIGFTLGESLSPKQISIVIEKTHPDYPGSAQFIFSEFCRQYWSDYPECNVGDDEGVPSLRFTKESYRSIRMLEKYVVKQKSKFSPDDFSNIPTSLNVDIPVIRKAKNEDVDAILQIEEISFDSQQEKFNRRQIRNLICNHRAIVSVIVVNEEVIGWAVCLIRQYDKYKTGRLYAIAISPGARRKKMGQKLLEHCINSLSSLGIFSISLEVRNNNEPAISLYRKMNFKDQAVLPDYYGLGKDGLRMKLLLTGV
jgi:ribosomal-protein-alanine N-acetyltransferase